MVKPVHIQNMRLAPLGTYFFTGHGSAQDCLVSRTSSEKLSMLSDKLHSMIFVFEIAGFVK